MKVCSKCSTEKPLEDFTADHSKRDGRKAQCKQCVRTAAKDRYSPDKRKKAYLAASPQARSRRVVRQRNSRWKVLAAQHGDRWLVEQVQSLKVTGSLTWDAIDKAKEDQRLAALFRVANRTSPAKLREAFGAPLWDEVRGATTSKADYVDRRITRLGRLWRLTPEARERMSETYSKEWASAARGMASITDDGDKVEPICDNAPTMGEQRRYASKLILDGK